MPNMSLIVRFIGLFLCLGALGTQGFFYSLYLSWWGNLAISIEIAFLWFSGTAQKMSTLSYGTEK